MLATVDWGQIGTFVAALVAGVVSALNRRSLRAKASNGDRTVFGRPKKKNVADVVALLEKRTIRFDHIEEKLNRLLRDVELPRKRRGNA